MNQRFVSVLLFAFIVAAGASAMLYRLLAHRATATADAPASRVVVAARDLEVGVLLRDQDLKLAPWSGAIPAGAAAKTEDVIGRGVTSAMYVNEPILQNRLAARGAGGGLAAMIPPGMRAVAVRVNEVVGVGGFVVPGMRVDVLISGNPPNADGRMGSLTKTLLQNIEVLSAGQDYRKDAEGKPVTVPVVNLLVTPEQAEKLSLAANQTVLQLVLRNPMDLRQAETPGTALAQLFGKLAPPPESAKVRPEPLAHAPTRMAAARPEPVIQSKAVSPPPFVMETINGSHRAETKFAGAAQ